MKILIIDDSAVMRNMIKRVVGASGFTADFAEASNGQEGLSAADDSCDLILCDWNMPEMNGIEFLRKYREGGGTVPVLMVTTETHATKVQEATNAGANGFIAKPFTPDKVSEEIKKACPDLTT